MRARRQLLTLATVASAVVVGASVATGVGSGRERAAKLVGGPVLFRLTGYEHVPLGSRRKDWRYLMVFRLDRNPAARRPTDLDPGFSRYGNYFLVGAHLSFDDIFERDSYNCFSFVAIRYDRWQEPLDRLKVGRRTKVTLRPLAPNPDGSVRLGKSYVTRPTLRRADVRLEGAEARRELKRIGCLKALDRIPQ